LLASIEWLIYSFRKTSFNLKDLKEFIISPQELEYFYKVNDFEWKEDFLGGFLDFASFPSVMLKKKCGDCEDFAYLSQAILGDDHNAKLCFIYMKHTGHVILLIDDSNNFSIMSNQYHRTGFTNELDAINFFYGEDTFFHFLK